MITMSAGATPLIDKRFGLGDHGIQQLGIKTGSNDAYASPAARFQAQATEGSGRMICSRLEASSRYSPTSQTIGHQHDLFLAQLIQSATCEADRCPGNGGSLRPRRRSAKPISNSGSQARRMS